MKVLFVCIHNSARSQMAEEILRLLSQGTIEVKSAGIEPGRLNPLVVKALQEIDIDIAGKETRSVRDLLNNAEKFDHVITVCDEASAAQCPRFPGIKDQIHWSFEDPSRLQGTEEQKLEKIRGIRDQIHSRIQEWLQQISERKRS